MEKPFYTSLTMWSGVFLFLIGIFQIATKGEIDVQSLTTALGALGLVGLRRAID